MKKTIPFIVLLILSIGGIIFDILFKDSMLSGLLLSSAFILLSIAFIWNNALPQNASKKVRAVAKVFCYITAAFALFSVWYNFYVVLGAF